MAGTSKAKSARQRLFGDNVRAYRSDTGLSQEAVALKAGLHRSYVASLEAGHRNPSLETIVRLAIALECTASELVAGTEAVPGRR